MRLLLVLLAVVGLIASPVSAAAAQVACSQMTASMSSASMSGAKASGMAGMQQGGVMKAGDPCCDHHGKGCPEKSCAQHCAAACAVSDALAAPAVSVPFVMAAADHAPGTVVSVHPFEPAGALRPPTPIA